MRCYFPKKFFRGDHFLFGLVLKKTIKSKFLKKWNQTETGSNRPILVWFSLEPGSNRFDLVFSVLARFFCLARFFSGMAWFWLGFFLVFFVWVRFGFFSSRLIKPKPNQTSRFFQNSNWFFFAIRFFRLFFSRFSRFNQVFNFFTHPFFFFFFTLNGLKNYYSRWYVIRYKFFLTLNEWWMLVQCIKRSTHTHRFGSGHARLTFPLLRLSEWIWYLRPIKLFFNLK
jgi:hypothetical protein